jgi:hypothetical protein
MIDIVIEMTSGHQEEEARSCPSKEFICARENLLGTSHSVILV